MRLCLHLGYPTIEKAQADIDAKAFAIWKAYFQVDDRHNVDFRDDLRAGIVASTIANCHRAKNTSAYRTSDMMPFFAVTDTPDRHQPTEEEIFRTFKVK